MTRVVEIERLIKHPLDRVYAVWLDPASFAEWFLPDPNVRLGRVELDAREGGAFLIEMIVGPQRLAHTGTYRTLLHNERIVFTWHSGATGDGETLVDVSFEARANHTLLRLRHSGLPTDDAITAHAHGWANIVGGVEPFLSKRTT